MMTDSTPTSDLLARADHAARISAIGEWDEAARLITDLAAALRAAEAENEPVLFEGTMADFIRRFDSLDRATPQLLDRIVVRAAVSSPSEAT